MTKPNTKDMMWVLATLTVALIPQLPRMPLPVLVMTVSPLLWRYLAELRGWSQLPALFRYAVTALSLAVLFVAHGSLFGRRASVSLLAAMLALKLLECERIRDARLVVSFSLFLCATQFLFAQGVFMPLYGLATIVVALVALSQLHRSLAFAALGVAPPVRVSLFAELAFSVRLLALAVPVGLAFFLFFPRWASPLWGVPETTLDAKTGLSDSMSPGSIQNLFMDDSAAFRVQFSSAIPAAEQLYWRGPVFWNYEDNVWTGSFYGRNIEAESLPEAANAPWRYTVQLEPNERNWLFALDYPVMAPTDTRISMDYQLLRRQPVIQLLQYSMSSNPDHIDTPVLKETLRSMALSLPADLNPRTREFMEQWRRETPNDAALIRRVLAHFNKENFHYSLEAPLLGQDAVDEFLFATRTGYCEHYASAFAVMMRMAGIPSRVVTGYQGGWYSNIGDYVLVRQSDAHAWTEVWLRGSGWTRVDPTAAVSPLRVQQGSLGALAEPRHLMDFDWIRNVRNGFDLFEQRWNDWIVRFGAGSQARMFSPLGIDHLTPAGLVTVLFVIVGVLGLLLLPLVFKTVAPGRRDPVLQAWQKFLRRLRKAGSQHLPSEAAMELAETASARLPGDAKQIHHIAGLYNRHRYSMNPPKPGEITAAVRNFHPGNSTP